MFDYHLVCYASFKSNWLDAASFADKLYTHSKWSKVLYLDVLCVHTPLQDIFISLFTLSSLPPNPITTSSSANQYLLPIQSAFLYLKVSWLLMSRDGDTSQIGGVAKEDIVKMLR